MVHESSHPRKRANGAQASIESAPEPVGTLLSRLRGVRQTGENRWQSLCPAHDDHRPSLSIGLGRRGKVLLRCHAGCNVSEICKAIGLSLKDLFPKHRGGGGVNSGDSAATPQHPESKGLDLREYASVKRLRLSFLRGLGLETIYYQRQKAVKIPYRDESGKEKAVRFRLSLGGADRFRSRKGDQLCLYGLDILKSARSAGSVVLVEGESDCQTLWSHGIPAVGLPGATNWNEQRDAHLFEGIKKIYVVIEPDAGGAHVLRTIARSRIRDRVRLIRLRHKDVSAMHIASPRRFLKRWRRAIREAVPFTRHQEEERHVARQQAFEQCRELATDPDILRRLQEDLGRLGVAGEQRVTNLLYLALTSRLLEQPVSLAIKSPSSSGKSFLVKQTLNFFPESAYYPVTAMSERALAYSQLDIRHRFLVVYELAGITGDFGTYLVRSLLSEGCLNYETVVKGPEGLVTRQIKREGPTGLITTTTLKKLHPENETRVLSVPVDDSPIQTRKVLRRMAKHPYEKVDFSRWHALQKWIENSCRSVQISFLAALAELVPVTGIRMRRDFTAMTNLIKSSAILHQAHRRRNKTGEIVATFADYQIVRRLTADLFASANSSSVPESVRVTTRAVMSLTKRHRAGVPLGALALKLKINKSNASRRVAEAVKRGLLANKQAKRGVSARIVVANELREDGSVLPDVRTLKERVAAMRLSGQARPSPRPGRRGR